MTLAALAAPPGNPPTNPPTNPDLGGPPVKPGAADSDKGFDGGKLGARKGGPGAGGPMGEGRGMAWMRTFDEMKSSLSAEVQAKAEAIKSQFEASLKTWRDANADKLKALADQMKNSGGKPDKGVMEQMKALRDTAPKPEDMQKQIFALLTPEQQTAFKEKLEANEKKMKERLESRGEGKGGGKGKGGKGGDAPPANGGGGDKPPPPPPFDP